MLDQTKPLTEYYTILLFSTMLHYVRMIRTNYVVKRKNSEI